MKKNLLIIMSFLLIMSATITALASNSAPQVNSETTFDTAPSTAYTTAPIDWTTGIPTSGYTEPYMTTTGDYTGFHTTTGSYTGAYTTTTTSPYPTTRLFTTTYPTTTRRVDEITTRTYPTTTRKYTTEPHSTTPVEEVSEKIDNWFYKLTQSLYRVLSVVVKPLLWIVGIFA